MSGHSKWSTIKHKKAAQDSKRGKMFGEVARMIRVAVKQGKSGDPNMNPALRLALDKARSVNMPKENISRAIEKGLGKTAGGATFDEVVYEGFGPNGIGLMIWVVTDNRNRSAAEIRTLFERAGGSLGGPGSTAYLFSVGLDGTATVAIPMPVEEAGVREKVDALVEALEERDEVEQIITNMSEEI
jgi:YebC/PmpR family DNA-binding regulatory protein